MIAALVFACLIAVVAMLVAMDANARVRRLEGKEIVLRFAMEKLAERSESAERRLARLEAVAHHHDGPTLAGGIHDNWPY